MKNTITYLFIGIVAVVFSSATLCSARSEDGDQSMIQPVRFANVLALHSLKSWSGSAPVAEQASVSVPDQVSLNPTQQFREPKEALNFLKGIDDQLGLSEAMKAEKRELMAESSHAFFRASPSLFYHDLQSTFLDNSKLLPDPAPRVAIVGDAHVLNAGTFRGPDGQPVWGLNDFDQAEIGSPEWDLERLGVSLYVAGRSGGLSAEESLKLVNEMGSSYLENLGKSGPAYLTRDEASEKVQSLIDKAASKDQAKFLTKWTNADATALVRNEDLEDPDPVRGAQVLDAIGSTFPELQVLDFASKPHSGGSTRGLERYYTLVQGDQAPWILEVKAVLPSPVQIPDGDLSRGDGAKVLGFQKLMGSPTDQRHGSFKLGDIAFFTREREREKGALGDKPKHLTEAAAQLGTVLARAHNASGADLQGWVDGRDEQLLENLGSFSQTYARQVESDFREFQTTYPAVKPDKTTTQNEGPTPNSVDGFHLNS